MKCVKAGRRTCQDPKCGRTVGVFLQELMRRCRQIGLESDVYLLFFFLEELDKPVHSGAGSLPPEIHNEMIVFLF